MYYKDLHNELFGIQAPTVFKLMKASVLGNTGFPVFYINANPSIIKLSE